MKKLVALLIGLFAAAACIQASAATTAPTSGAHKSASSTKHAKKSSHGTKHAKTSKAAKAA